ncbi:MAG: hypothetical protein IJ759_07060 [Bacteroidales bacterium]|nr:hypothetical protein [Bacteroidales bacterium]
MKKEVSIKEQALPQNLQHKPIYVVDYYEKDIEANDKPNGDTQYLSLGMAGWDNTVISAKIFRHTGQKWSRQSEDIPLHRLLDLTILLISRITDQKSSSLKEHVNPHFEEHIEDLDTYIKDHKSKYDIRLKEIKELLKDYEPSDDSKSIQN